MGEVDIFTSDGWEAESLARDERTPELLKTIAHDHTLTILDAFPTNPLWKFALELATDVIVVSTPRNDSLSQAATLLEKLAEEGSALPQKTLHPPGLEPGTFARRTDRRGRPGQCLDRI